MISANKLCKRFGPVRAVNNVSFEVEKGEIVGFLGSNAAGKTTTMRILTCYFPPSSGSATVAGYDIFNDSLKVRRHVGYLPENVPLYDGMPVDYFLDFVASLKGVGGKEREQKVESAIKRCGLEPVFDERIGNLSKGFRQRVGIAQAIITDPPVLILDEPTVGLDPKQIIEIRSLIKSFGGKSTVILSTHILHEIEKVCNRILIIDEGEILEFDTLKNLSEKLQDKYSINLTVKGPTEKVKNTLKEINGVEKVRDMGKLDKGIYKYRLITKKEPALLEVISTGLSNNEFIILEMFREQMSAEDIFRKVVPDHVKKISEEELQDKKVEKEDSKGKKEKKSSKDKETDKSDEKGGSK
ncbi:MAG: ABC transporter ATP-binding protein [Candidatus Eremiobacteraeota bacterium]|nr:ABC transporter ATP-binding protein [Candidatus Eremiobacteraeota bacterium]